MREKVTKRYTKEELETAFENSGLHLFENQEYIDSRHKLSCYDDEGYKYYLSLSSINDKRTGHSIVTKYNIYSIENIQKYIENNGSKTKVLSKEYIANKEKLELQCECGNIYYEHWNHIKVANKIRCPKCGRKRMGDQQTYSKEQIEEKCNEYGYELIGYENAHNIYVKDKDGYKYKTSLGNIDSNKNTKYGKFISRNPFQLDNMKLFLKLNGNSAILSDKNINNITTKDNYLILECPKCRKEFNAKWENIAYGSRVLCDECCMKQSNLEYIVAQYLKSQNIKYICQKRYSDCRNIRELPFDFYLIDYNVCIEVQGEQHYHETNIYKQTLEERQRLDKIKKDYCVNNNIGYLEIPFWNIYNNRKYSNNFIKQIQKIISQD